ncbi:unnamed protein product [Lathyrus sativus]|nr:unnamed protein product [Lathyrus sativus]
MAYQDTVGEQLRWLLFIDISEMLPCSVVSSLVVIRLSYIAGFMSIFQHLEKEERTGYQLIMWVSLER